ncbi:hypothetical protein AYI68_g3930 [Smittium mucronatum]|uniref:Protein ecm33 n=1 Tax=Smittium mucronatum TaxID=133383 RepID=A0A1R0GYJ5_9FUNG|nr:hypothetical protein AYI68_g3930 [Smittium mucronatum]
MKTNLLKSLFFLASHSGISLADDLNCRGSKIISTMADMNAIKHCETLEGSFLVKDFEGSGYFNLTAQKLIGSFEVVNGNAFGFGFPNLKQVRGSLKISGKNVEVINLPEISSFYGSFHLVSTKVNSLELNNLIKSTGYISIRDNQELLYLCLQKLASAIDREIPDMKMKLKGLSGGIKLENNPKLMKVLIPSLAIVGDFLVSGSGLEYIDANNMVYSNSVILKDNFKLNGVDFPNLLYCNENLILKGKYTNAYFDNLKSIRGSFINYLFNIYENNLRYINEYHIPKSNMENVSAITLPRYDTSVNNMILHGDVGTKTFVYLSDIMHGIVMNDQNSNKCAQFTQSLRKYYGCKIECSVEPLDSIIDSIFAAYFSKYSPQKHIQKLKLNSDPIVEKSNVGCGSNDDSNCYSLSCNKSQINGCKPDLQFESHNVLNKSEPFDQTSEFKGKSVNKTTIESSENIQNENEHRKKLRIDLPDRENLENKSEQVDISEDVTLQDANFTNDIRTSNDQTKEMQTEGQEQRRETMKVYDNSKINASGSVTFNFLIAFILCVFVMKLS